MSKVTIILPVSRKEFVPKLFASLELLDCKRSETNLLVIVDGNSELYVDVRNHVEQSKFAQRLCVQFKSEHKLQHYDVYARRLRISDIHNFARQYLMTSEFVFGIEDDTLVQPGALKQLLKDYSEYPHAGFIEGVELGRWGVPYVGAWLCDDIYEPTTITSVMPGDINDPDHQRLTNIDAGGMYCFLTRFETYDNHVFETFENNSLGPDVNFGMTLRKEGYENYIDWSVRCTHRTKQKDITLLNTEPRRIEFTKKEKRWRQSAKNSVI